MTARKQPFPRCGVARESRRVTVLCKSCVDVLTVEERKAWK